MHLPQYLDPFLHFRNLSLAVSLHCSGDSRCIIFTDKFLLYEPEKDSCFFSVYLAILLITKYIKEISERHCFCSKILLLDLPRSLDENRKYLFYRQVRRPDMLEHKVLGWLKFTYLFFANVVVIHHIKIVQLRDLSKIA